MEVHLGDIQFSKRFMSGSFRIANPPNPPIPVTVLTGPTSVGSCDRATLDASLSYNTGGRPRYRWKVVSVDGKTNVGQMANATNLTDYIKELNGWEWVDVGDNDDGEREDENPELELVSPSHPRHSLGSVGGGASSDDYNINIGNEEGYFSTTELATFTSDHLSPGSKYIFNITVKSFFGTRKTVTHRLFMSEDPIPMLWVDGQDAFTIFRSDAVRARVDGEASTCVANAQLQFFWFMEDQIEDYGATFGPLVSGYTLLSQINKQTKQQKQQTTSTTNNHDKQ